MLAALKNLLGRSAKRIGSRARSNDSSGMPAEFDAGIYRAHNADVRSLSDEAAWQHYVQSGCQEGRFANACSMRADFVALLAANDEILEIGPLVNPTLRGPTVRYFDVLPTEDLKIKAQQHGLDPALCPTIDYCSPTGDLAVINKTFQAVVSSHAIEHQPDLVAHLQGVERILREGGRYFLAIPDKRYCFDHFIPESSIVDVLSAHEHKVRTHSLLNVMRHVAQVTHNDAIKHWSGDHGEPAWHSDRSRFSLGTAAYQGAAGGYVDCHAWQFTPASFREVVTTLHEQGLIGLAPVRVYPTVRNAIEFYAVLERV